ncbi:hypothetical protein OAG68_00245 [bacterium]|nr:hypothetical protein [bacterium]
MNRRKSNGPSKLCGSLLDLFRAKPSKRASAGQNCGLTVSYETLEERRVLASLFPTFVNGTFTLGDDTGASPYALADTFQLESNPGASKVIYLDFNGHHSVNNDWGHDIMFPAFDRDGDVNNFSDAELIEIQLQFQNTAEDFLPFDVNVTTIDPGLEALRRTSGTDNEYGVRVVATQATDGFGGFGGVAFLNSFSDSIDNPVFTLNKGENVGAQTNSHEVGHALGLRHDGLGSQQYHPGVGGSGPISWGPLMGAPFNANLSQWSNGDYANSTNTEDDLSIITSSSNGFGFRADDYGSTIATASDLAVATDFSVTQWGIIERNNDVDMFKFSTGDGPVTFNIDPFGERANLDVIARIFDASGNVVATSNPAGGLNASFSMELTAGTYYLSIDGTTNANNASDYGSLGFYTLNGQVTEPNPVDPIGEAGSVSTNHLWKTVTLQRTYANPVVIMGPASRNGGDPVTVRVDNVTSTSFDVAIDEWDYRDGRHGFESISYLVVEAGTHTLADGTTLHAANDPAVDHRWNNIDFDAGLFTRTPLVFTQTTSYVDQAAVATRARNIDTAGFQVRLQEEQAADRVHANESVAWIAIEETGVGTFADGSQYEASQTGEQVRNRPFRGTFSASFSGVPTFLAAMQTYVGGDVSTVRSRGLTDADFVINIEEERSADNEIGHVPESVGIFALPVGILNAKVETTAPLASALAAFDNYDAGSNTETAWAAYNEMLSWGQEWTPLADAHDLIETDGQEAAASLAAPLLSNFYATAQSTAKFDSSTPERPFVDTNSVDLGLAGMTEAFEATDEAFERFSESSESTKVTLEQATELDELASLS